MKKSVHVVAAIIMNEQKKILCAKRSPKMSLPNYWEFPGGKIERSESKKEALKREILEELGCKISVGSHVEDTTYEYDNLIIRLETFYAKILSGQPLAKEHSKIKWVSVADLHQLHWAPADIPAVRKVEKQCMKVFTNS